MSNVDYTARINNAKAAVEKMKTDQIKAEQNKENLEKREAEYNAEIKTMGVNPDELNKAIEQLDIDADLLMIENMIPAEYLPQSGERNA
ncbi:MAG: hypothetical protein PHE26_10910 [Syntrophomonadaceae bacterium]|nr:hypothetical protein [Syntrophomonadaceae bacterium]